MEQSNATLVLESAQEESRDALIERLLDAAELDYRCCGHHHGGT